VTIMKLSCKL